MATPSGNSRRHWEEGRRKRQPSLYDEWLAEEKANKAAQKETAEMAMPQAGTPRAQAQDSLGGTASSSIRTVTPEAAEPTERGTTSFERAFLPTTTTTIVGGPAAIASSPEGSSVSTRFRRNRDLDTGSTNSRSSPISRSGGGVNGRGMLARSDSQNNGEMPPTSATQPYQPTRPRTRTLDERRPKERSHTALRHRHRMGSIDAPQSPPSSDGAEYLASVPASTSPPSVPSISSLGSPVLEEDFGGRSISPISSHTSDTTPGALPSANTRRILHLMKTLSGKMSGNTLFRSARSPKWRASYCFIKEGSGSLMYEHRDSEGDSATLIPDLRGCKITLAMEDETPYINISVPHSSAEIQLKLSNQADFDAWFAALLCWQPLEPREARKVRPQPIVMPLSRPEPAATASSGRSSSAHGNDSRTRANSGRSNRRKSVLMTSQKEAPVIKIGKMKYWDTNAIYHNPANSALIQSSSGRSQSYSFSPRRDRRISAQLRENGELKLHSDDDNSLITVVQLSQLSRCAIQRLDASVLDNEYCIAIYPQYTSSQTSSSSLLRPIFLSLEDQVLYEVWFVLLRAFTIPSLYGPHPSSGDAEAWDFEDLLAKSTLQMFRMERSLHVRVVEAKLYPPTSGVAAPEAGFVGGHGKGNVVRPEQFGYHVEVLLDNETRGKTAVKFDGLNPLWGENFDFLDLPPVLLSASVVIKRRPPDHLRTPELLQSKQAYALSREGEGRREGNHGGINFDATCGKVEIILEELAATNEVEKWWPAHDSYGQRVGEILIRARAEEGVILMAKDYKPLSELLHRFSNGLTLQIAQIIPGELKRLSEYLLNIFQVSGCASDWIMALVEEEIDSVHKETPLSRLRYSRRAGSNENDPASMAKAHNERELLVRDMNKNAALEANLLFRGNTLLTKSLDSHMRRIGRQYLEDAIGAEINKINASDPDCEVDPNRISSPTELQRNWIRLESFTQAIWKSIMDSRQKCPIELRRIFRHVQTCAEDRYGDFLRSVSYSSVSGFLFLRFFCPAVLNPKLFGLLKHDMKPRARRTCTLIAKSLQTLANMASFGTKEHWMEPMNKFLLEHREEFKSFIDDICYVPTPVLNQGTAISARMVSPTSTSSNTIAADGHLSYTTPMTIMLRLPPTSREGFPSLPYLIDQARAFAELIQLWLETTAQTSDSNEAGTTGKPKISLAQALEHADGDLRAFHEVCITLNAHTQECLSRAERAERPNSALSLSWDELIDQLERPETDDDTGFAGVADRIASDPNIVPMPQLERLVAQLQPAALLEADDEDEFATRMYESTPPESSSSVNRQHGSASSRNLASASMSGSLRRTDNLARNGNASNHSPSASASASASNVSSAVSSDTEHTTALPMYEREERKRSSGRVPGVNFLQHRSEKKVLQKEKDREKDKERESERDKEKQKEKRKGKALLPPLRKRKE